MTPSELRVCIVAEHASTRMGGEAILPYHYFRVLRSRGIDAWLVVHERSRAELIELFPTELDRIRFVPDQTLQKIFFRAGSFLPRRIAEATFGLANQMLTQFAQRAEVRRLANENAVVHQPIPVSPRFPSLLWELGAPVVIGPMNGAMEYPPAFRGSESIVSRFAIVLGRSMSNIVNRILPGKLQAAVLLVANRRTRAALPNGVRGQVIEVVENGVDLTSWNARTEAENATARFVFIGRLVDWKAVDIAIEAMRSVPSATLDVIGDGPMLEKWRRFAEASGVSERVLFHGWRSQAECAEVLRGSCALLLPSLFECGGAVVLEAMASGRPVIATAWGGPADYLDASCGFLIEPCSRAALVSGFVEAMQRLLDDPATARALGAAGRARVMSKFDWEKKVDAVLEIYDSALEGAVPEV